MSAPRLIGFEAPGWGRGCIALVGSSVLFVEPPEAGPAPTAAAPETALERDLAARLAAFYRGDARGFGDVDIAAALAGMTDFQRAVTAAIRAVQRGATASYGEIAAAAGAPRAARAAGSACAAGTVPLIVPYHRIISADGSIGSYGPDGVPVKRRLLALEGVRL